MPKLSIYVQDELWEQAQEIADQVKPSHLVQTALDTYVETFRKYCVCGEPLHKDWKHCPHCGAVVTQ